VQVQEAADRGAAFSKILDRVHKEHRAETKASSHALASAETKHAAYTEALVSQMKAGLVAAVKQCKQLERDATTER